MLLIKDVNQKHKGREPLTEVSQRTILKKMKKKTTYSTGSDHSFNSFIINNFIASYIMR